MCPKGKKKHDAYKTIGSKPDNFTCVGCAAGFWSDSDADDCTQCPNGFYSNQTKSKSCQVCEAGRYNPNVASSEMMNVSCIKCMAGRYSSAKGATRSDDCNKCAAGKKNPHEGATLSMNCTECAVDYLSKNNRVLFLRCVLFWPNSCCWKCSLCRVSKRENENGVRPR